MAQDNLHGLKDDMNAFLTGHGLRQFPGHVGDDVPTVLWEDEGAPDGWKRLVETAKAAGAPFLTLSDVTVTRDELDGMLEQLREQNFPDEEAPELDEVQALRRYAGKVGFVQLGFVHQGVAFVHETATEWYERYEALLEAMEAYGSGSIAFDEDEDA